MDSNLVDIREYAKVKEKRKSKWKNAGNIAAFLGPYAISFIMFFVFPLLFGIIMAFSTFSAKSIYPESIGTFKNFEVLFSDNAIARDFWSSVWTTIKFCLCIVPLSLVVPLILALLTNTCPPGYKIFRACIYLPGIFPLTATGLILLRLFDSHYGMIDALFNTSIDWFGDVNTCWFMIGLFCLWGGIGGNYIIYCAGLKNVDKSLYEAAEVDGCNRWETFMTVTLPGIKPQIFITLFSTFIGYMNVYGQLYILASNNADLSSMKSAVYRIQDILAGSNPRSFGYAAAMGILLGLIIIVIAIVQVVVSNHEKKGHKYENKFSAWKKSK